ncbi:hypothetical protein BDV30DRAFT_243631 [Aspergillus minisclerotigenes]|uniref:Uncharacterized protein n=1 Tax=Aspergillus minisclerotigenes TaxID=656917 RepID=A0A5N6IP25_9EURO|nr:hypothetical protein BDV30DRAFT_243631 [Aspergillus minisclerotigenes]
MAVVVNPYIPLASVEDREKVSSFLLSSAGKLFLMWGKYLSLVHDVAHETHQNEPECLAYCWTRPISTSEAPTDGDTFVQGIEVYKSLDALAIVHRSSPPYLKMREVVNSTGLITFPKGGVPMYEPAGTGFLTKRGAAESVSTANHFVVIQYTVKGSDNLSFFLDQEKLLCNEMKVTEGVQTMWCFVPHYREMEVPITIFIRLEDVSYYDGLEARILAFE